MEGEGACFRLSEVEVSEERQLLAAAAAATTGARAAARVSLSRSKEGGRSCLLSDSRSTRSRQSLPAPDCRVVGAAASEV